MKESLNELPLTSYLPVATRNLKAGTIVWANGSIKDDAILLENAFCLKQDYESESVYGSSQKVQYCDRYGGYGVGVAGGSGRCATVGALQIKGVGKTPLLPINADQYHSSGLVLIPEAAYEVIWSEIFANVLPFGVVGNIGIVAHPENSRPFKNMSHEYRRTLLYRDFAVRPAHFLRNIHFKSQGNCVDGLGLDAIRCRNAIQSINICFDSAFSLDVRAARGTEKLNLGLKTMAHRFAAQVAASFAKRLFHGALSCSNIALDGRYLDFGCADYVPCYRPAIFSINSADQWTQESSLLRTLNWLRTHIEKYSGTDRLELIPNQKLNEYFNSEFVKLSQIEMLKMTGVPSQFSNSFPIDVGKDLFNCICKIYKSGAGEVFVGYRGGFVSEERGSLISRFGHYDLNEIFTLAAISENADDMRSKIAHVISDNNLCNEFVRTYCKFTEQYYSNFVGDELVAARYYLRAQAVRLNTQLDFLARDNLLGKALTEVERSYSEMNSFIKITIDRALNFLSQDHPALTAKGALYQILELRDRGMRFEDSIMSLGG